MTYREPHGILPAWLQVTYGFPSVTMVYNDDNRLTSITYGTTTDTYTYNWQGLRTRARLGGTYSRYLYNGERVLEELNDSGATLARYTTTNGSYYEPLLGFKRSDGSQRFPLYNATGTVRRLADNTSPNPHITDVYSYDTFGKGGRVSGSTPNPYQFGGAWGYITDPSGMEQLGQRFYWPEVGRFLQQDPAKDGGNWYVYAGSRPVLWVDPTGLGLWSSIKCWWHQFGPHSGGLGLQGTGLVGLIAGAGAAGEAGGGYFSGSGFGGYASGGAFYGLPGAAYSSPAGAYGPYYPYALGLYAGGGVYGWLSNAQTPADLNGPAVSFDLGLAFPPPFNWSVSGTLSYNGAYVVGFRPPGASWGLAAGAMAYGSYGYGGDLFH